VSNFEGEDREFDELDLPAEDSTLPEPADETLELGGAGEVPEPGDDVLEPAESDAFADMEMAAPADEFAAEAAEEELEEEAVKQPGFLQKVTKASPYVVLLGISLLAILIGIFCWFMELKSYDFQMKPAQTSMAPAVQSGPPSTTTTV